MLQIELPLPLPTKGVVFREMDWFVIKPLGKPQRVTARSIVAVMIIFAVFGNSDVKDIGEITPVDVFKPNPKVTRSVPPALAGTSAYDVTAPPLLFGVILIEAGFAAYVKLVVFT